MWQINALYYTIVDSWSATLRILCSLFANRVFNGALFLDSWICILRYYSTILTFPFDRRIAATRDFHPASRDQRGKHVEHTSAAFRIKGVAVFALRSLAQPLGRPIFPILVLVVFFFRAGRPGIPWNFAYTGFGPAREKLQRSRRARKTNAERPRVQLFIGENPSCVFDAVFIKYRRRRDITRSRVIDVTRARTRRSFIDQRGQSIFLTERCLDYQ